MIIPTTQRPFSSQTYSRFQRQYMRPSDYPHHTTAVLLTDVLQAPTAIYETKRLSPPHNGRSPYRRTPGSYGKIWGHVIIPTTQRPFSLQTYSRFLRQYMGSRDYPHHTAAVLLIFNLHIIGVQASDFDNILGFQRNLWNLEHRKSRKITFFDTPVML